MRGVTGLPPDTARLSPASGGRGCPSLPSFSAPEFSLRGKEGKALGVLQILPEFRGGVGGVCPANRPSVTGEGRW